MVRILVVTVLSIFCLAPALGAPMKTQTAAKHTHVGPHSDRLSNALGGFNRGDPNDPYWEPCLSYYRSWGPGACGR